MGTSGKKILNQEFKIWISPNITPVGVSNASAVAQDIPQYEAMVHIGDKLVLKSSLPDYALHLYDQNKKTTQAIAEHFETLLNQSPFLQKWQEEGIEEPSNHCRITALNVSKKLFEQYSLIPARIAPSIEEGIMVTYVKKDVSSLKIEFYNTNECAAILTLPDNITECIDITNEQQLLTLAGKYSNTK